jgi:hypothetical protein
MPAKKNTNRLPGHELPFEGQALAGLPDYAGGKNGAGRTRCSCDLVSPVISNTAGRRLWHREHKEAVRARDSENGLRLVAPGILIPEDASFGPSRNRFDADSPDWDRQVIDLPDPVVTDSWSLGDMVDGKKADDK